ncbi:hypothetical protein, partial [Facklamia hominis]
VLKINSSTYLASFYHLQAHEEIILNHTYFESIDENHLPIKTVYFIKRKKEPSCLRPLNS